MKQVYYEALFSPLVPVEEVKRISGTELAGIVSQQVPNSPYKEGEQIRSLNWHFVHLAPKSRQYPYHVMVSSVDPTRFPEAESYQEKRNE